jgi:hypothetical protein
MKQKILLCTLLILGLCSQLFGQDSSSKHQPSEPIIEVRVKGRQPGPPLWQVKKGDNTLYIFPHLNILPKDMIWEDDKVAEVLSTASVLMEMPSVDVSVSPWVALNPFNIVRGLNLRKRMMKNRSQNLAASLPPELFQRFQILQERYSLRGKIYRDGRPLFVAEQMEDDVLAKEKLVPGTAILKQIDKLARKSKDLKRIKLEQSFRLDGSFSDLASRAERMLESITLEAELACFEDRLERLERDLEEIVYRAESWAKGYMEEFFGVNLQGSDSDRCMQLLFSSSEGDTLQSVRSELEMLWLKNAREVLASQHQSMAIVSIRSLLRKGGIIDTLRGEGYLIKEP